MTQEHDSIGRIKTEKGAPIRFVETAVHSDTDKCILWPYSKDENGYGKIIINGRRYRTHRLVLTLCKGESNLHVLHGCLNKACCNPRHLRYGTHQENMQDMVKDETYRKGSDSPASKLKEEQIPNILNDKRSLRAIAKDYGVDHKTIFRIKSRRGWKHVGVAA